MDDSPDRDTLRSGRAGVTPPKSAGKRVTLSDIAKAAGVSRATVSLVMRDSPTIPKRTHDLVLKNAGQLGYVYNRAAANLRTSNSHIIGLAVHDITNPYFAEIVAEVQRELAAHGRVVFLGNTQDSPDLQQNFINSIREYNVAGIIMSPAAGTDPEWVRKLQDWHLPCVLFSRNLPDTGLDYVGGSYFAGMKQQTEHLIALGHREIAFIASNEAISSGRARLDGYHAALDAAGIRRDPDLVIPCEATRKAAHDAVIGLLKRDKIPTAAACFNDVTAFGAILALNNLGLNAGSDFSVSGFDDIAEAILWRPALTTQHISCKALGREAVRLLLRRIAQPDAPAEEVLLPLDLRVRGTTSAPASPQRQAAIRKAAREIG